MSRQERDSNNAPDRSAAPDEFSKTLLGETTRNFESWLGNVESSAPVEPVTPPHPPAPLREIKFEGTLEVDGYVAGHICSTGGILVLLPAGEVDGDISVDIAFIHGKVRGEIHAAIKVVLGSSGHVIGDIETLELDIEPGARFQGRCNFPGTDGNEPSADRDDAEIALAAAV